MKKIRGHVSGTPIELSKGGMSLADPGNCASYNGYVLDLKDKSGNIERYRFVNVKTRQILEMLDVESLSEAAGKFVELTVEGTGKHDEHVTECTVVEEFDEMKVSDDIRSLICQQKELNASMKNMEQKISEIHEKIMNL